MYKGMWGILLGIVLSLLACSRPPVAPGNEEMRSLLQAMLYGKANQAFFHEGYQAKLDEQSLAITGLELVSGNFEAQGSAYRAVVKIRYRVAADPNDKKDPHGRAARIVLDKIFKMDVARIKRDDQFEQFTEKVFLNDGKGWKLAP